MTKQENVIRAATGLSCACVASWNLWNPWAALLVIGLHFIVVSLAAEMR